MRYTTAQFVPIREDHPPNSQSPYAASKASADQIVMSYHRSFNLPVTILRPFNTFGPRQSMRAVIPTIIGQFLTSKNTIGNLTPTRDFTFVKDTVEAFTKSLKAKDIIGETINIGSNFEVSIKEIMKWSL